MKKHFQSFLSVIFLISTCVLWGQTSVKFTSSSTWQCPTGVDSVTVECWGGGGPGGNGKAASGGNGIGGGGAGGAYVRSTISVTPGNTYAVTVGASRTFATSGNPSWFGSTSTVYAQGGANGLSGISNNGSNKYGVGGTASSGSSIGTVVFKGGNGYTPTTTASAGGGGSAGDASNGNSATNSSGATLVTNGGAGGDGSPGSNQSGSAGSVPGGGGGGGWGTGAAVKSGGAGAAGQVILTYTVSSLPVELASFTASIINKEVNLQWNTATEVNNYGFEIQRTLISSVTADKWTKVGFVKGGGNSNSPKQYSYVDSKSFNCRVKYRLKQIDNDGTFHFSNIVEVKSLPTDFKLDQNYPNPFNPLTIINYSLPVKTNVILAVYNLLGEKVATLVNGEMPAGNHSVNFGAGKLSSGVYIYVLDTGNFNSSKKFVLLK